MPLRAIARRSVLPGTELSRSQHINSDNVQANQQGEPVAQPNDLNLQYKNTNPQVGPGSPGTPVLFGQALIAQPSVYQQTTYTATTPTGNVNVKVQPTLVGGRVQYQGYITQNQTFTQPISQTSGGFTETGTAYYTYALGQGTQLTPTLTGVKGNVTFNNTVVGTLGGTGQITPTANTVQQPVYGQFQSNPNAYLGTITLTPQVTNGNLSLTPTGFTGTTLPYTTKVGNVGVTTQIATGYNYASNQITFANLSPNFQVQIPTVAQNPQALAQNVAYLQGVNPANLSGTSLAQYQQYQSLGLIGSKGQPASTSLVYLPGTQSYLIVPNKQTVYQNGIFTPLQSTTPPAYLTNAVTSYNALNSQGLKASIVFNAGTGTFSVSYAPASTSQGQTFTTSGYLAPSNNPPYAIQKSQGFTLSGYGAIPTENAKYTATNYQLDTSGFALAYGQQPPQPSLASIDTQLLFNNTSTFASAEGTFLKALGLGFAQGSVLSVTAPVVAQGIAYTQSNPNASIVEKGYAIGSFTLSQIPNITANVATFGLYGVISQFPYTTSYLQPQTYVTLGKETLGSAIVFGPATLIASELTRASITYEPQDTDVTSFSSQSNRIGKTSFTITTPKTTTTLQGIATQGTFEAVVQNTYVTKIFGRTFGKPFTTDTYVTGAYTNIGQLKPSPATAQNLNTLSGVNFNIVTDTVAQTYKEGGGLIATSISSKPSVTISNEWVQNTGGSALVFQGGSVAKYLQISDVEFNTGNQGETSFESAFKVTQGSSNFKAAFSLVATDATLESVGFISTKPALFKTEGESNFVSVSESFGITSEGKSITGFGIASQNPKLGLYTEGGLKYININPIIETGVKGSPSNPAGSGGGGGAGKNPYFPEYNPSNQQNPFAGYNPKSSAYKGGTYQYEYLNQGQRFTSPPEATNLFDIGSTVVTPPSIRTIHSTAIFGIGILGGLKQISISQANQTLTKRTIGIAKATNGTKTISGLVQVTAQKQSPVQIGRIIQVPTSILTEVQTSIQTQRQTQKQTQTQTQKQIQQQQNISLSIPAQTPRPPLLPIILPPARRFSTKKRVAQKVSAFRLKFDYVPDLAASFGGLGGSTRVSKLLGLSRPLRGKKK